MLILLSWLLSLSAISCELPDAKKIVSLSGSMTVALLDMKLLSGIKGISVFHPITDEQYKGKRYPGGIFLSSKLLQEFEEHIVFYDESRDLKRFFDSRPKILSVEIKTRGLSPMEVSREVAKKLLPYTKGCLEVFRGFERQTEKEIEGLILLIAQPLKVIFFLGEIRGEKVPEMILGKDGVIKTLSEKNKLLTYPSDLPSLHWSSKLLGSMREFKRVGLIDLGPATQKKLAREGSRNWNLSFPGILVPGLSQVRGFRFFLEQWVLHAEP